VQEPFDRAWRRVGLALDRVGFTVEDRDRSKVITSCATSTRDRRRYQKNDGFLSSWRSGNSKTPTKSEQYRILSGTQGQQPVQVQNKDGGAESSATASRILALLQIS